ncbi:MAG: 50S ribosomal protein L9 [Cyanobacteria bacterium]|nr:50S ribosomal protein L9 [Cyanobacteriota bacterium]MDW8199820.1 50S ribosomal protein L9 [Cyanobacteriota bacterium SKYGB_h_bin112]
MAKRVQVVLKEAVAKLGNVGDVVDVAPGYARNYLIPRGVAVHTTPAILRQVERWREQERQRLAALKQEAEELKAALEKLAQITVSKQAGEENVLFGTVTDREVAELIQQAIGKEIDRRNITLPAIKKLGTYTASIKLHPEVTAAITVEVVAA